MRRGEPVRGEEGTATHARVAVPFQLESLLLADVVGNHPFGGTPGRQLGQVIIRSAWFDVVLFQHIDQFWKGRSDPDTFLVLHSPYALDQHFLDAEGQVFLDLLVSGFVQIHEDGEERSLSVGRHKGDYLVLDGLDALFDLLAQPFLDNFTLQLLGRRDAEQFELFLCALLDPLSADVDEGGQVLEGNRLASILVRGYLRDDLGGDVAGGGKAVRALDLGAADHRSVLQHVVQVDQVAVVHVLGVVVGVVEMDDSFLVRLDDFLGKQQAAGDVLGDFSCHIVALDAVDHRILVAVFLLDLLVLAFQKREDPGVGGVGMAGQGAVVTIADVGTGHLVCPRPHQLGLDHVLDLLHRGGPPAFQTTFGDGIGNLLDPGIVQFRSGYCLVCLADGDGNLVSVELDFRPVAFNDFHAVSQYTWLYFPRGDLTLTVAYQWRILTSLLRSRKQTQYSTEPYLRLLGLVLHRYYTPYIVLYKFYMKGPNSWFRNGKGPAQGGKVSSCQVPA